MKKITVQNKYTGYAEFTPRRAGVFAFLVKEWQKIARVYKIKEEKGKKKRKVTPKEFLPGTVKIQNRPHSTLERTIHKSNDWMSLPVDLILPLIKILQEWYVELNKEEVPEVAAFEKVSEDKELSKDIEDIGL